MNKSLAGHQLQQVAGEQADDYSVGKGEKKASVTSCGQGQRTCSLAEHSLSASSRRQLDSISGSASPAAHIIFSLVSSEKKCAGRGRGGSGRKMQMGDEGH